MRILSRRSAGLRSTLAVALALASQPGHAVVDLPTAPLQSSAAIPSNILFLLDDSGSMNRDFSPDWAGPYQQMVASVLTTITPPHRFFNASYNGVAYNPATRYRPPAMFDSEALPTPSGPMNLAFRPCSLAWRRISPSSG